MAVTDGALDHGGAVTRSRDMLHIISDHHMVYREWNRLLSQRRGLNGLLKPTSSNTSTNSSRRSCCNLSTGREADRLDDPLSCHAVCHANARATRGATRKMTGSDGR